MQVRKAKKADLPEIRALAGKLGLDYPGMEGDRFWVADESGRVTGMVGLKEHPDCLELCALGVDPGHRGQGIAAALVRALLDAVRADVHLATIIPSFFERCGFVKVAAGPRSFLEKWDTAWCEGCDRKSCTIMVSRTP